MKIFKIVVLCILVFLAVSSGAAKIMQVPQDVEFFGKYGFGSAMLIAFGAVQLAGGLMMIISQTRLIGAVLVAITFAISAVMLIMEESIMIAIVTLVALGLLGLIIRNPSLRPRDK